MKILGVDPGLRTSGYAVIAPHERDVQVIDAGTITADEKLPLAERLAQIFAEIESLLDEHQPAVMAVEELYAHYKHPRTAILMGHARGMFLLAATRRDISVKGYSATRVKKSVTGSGRASKEQIQLAVMTQLNLAKLPSPTDVADALAIAMCCWNEQARDTQWVS